MKLFFTHQKTAGLMLVLGSMLALIPGQSGCSGSTDSTPELVDVYGSLTVNGKPATNITVLFLSEAGDDSSGTTDAEGKFQLMYHGGKRSGAAPGTHQVQFATGSPDLPATPLPVQYLSGESRLTVEVTSPGPNEIPLELKGK